ncbi:MAG: hypothetical protein EOP07_12775 [Proteobacteria bacterium]|nr:MAG: hypothetical protein EOP07_12775 [Pseudomonadota bacterium]
MIRYSLSLFVVLATMVACSDSNFKGGVTTTTPPSESANAEIPKTTPTPVSPTTPIEPITTACAAAAGKLKETTQKISFPARTAACSFLAAGATPTATGNLPKQNGTLTAQETTSAEIAIPPGKICDIGIKSDASAAFRYDDMLIMSIDKNVLFFSTDHLITGPFQGLLEQTNGIYQWAWEKVRGKIPTDFGPSRDGRGKAYCVGDLTTEECQIPPTDTAGPISVALPIGKIAPISDYLANKKTAMLNLTATGDDDDGTNTKDIDCTHTALDVTVSFKYIP